MTDKSGFPLYGFEGTTARTPGPDLTEDTLEEACVNVVSALQGYGFAYRCWRLHGCPAVLIQATFGWDPEGRDLFLREQFARLQKPRMRTDRVPLYDGDAYIGEMTIERPWDARDNLPFVERVHPDDKRTWDALDLGKMVEVKDMRVQRFNLENGRYRLEHAP